MEIEKYKMAYFNIGHLVKDGDTWHSVSPISGMNVCVETSPEQCAALCRELIAESTPFAVDPWPDDRYVVYVKEEATRCLQRAIDKIK